MPAPYSIYEDVCKLRPGTILTLRCGERRRARRELLVAARRRARAAPPNRFTASEDEAVEELDRLLRDAVRLRMVADVPLGVFLSGGIDSSLVVGADAGAERARR